MFAHAAKLATENGYSQCYDILQGFEGDKDHHGHRKLSEAVQRRFALGRCESEKQPSGKSLERLLPNYSSRLTLKLKVTHH